MGLWRWAALSLMLSAASLSRPLCEPVRCGSVGKLLGMCREAGGKLVGSWWECVGMFVSCSFMFVLFRENDKCKQRNVNERKRTMQDQARLSP